MSNLCKVILLKSDHPKAFCAGGDVKHVVELAAKNDPMAIKFFEEEYQLNYMLGTTRKPVVALINGYTMGGGVGLSVHTPFRVATENTVFAMPETRIGLFPDVGGTYFLPRMDGALGTYLALTGAQLRGEDTLYAGIATHYVPSSRLNALQDRLCEMETDDPDVVNYAIEEFVGEPDKPFTLAPHRATIDACFQHGTVDAIVQALEQEGSEWSQQQIATLKQMSPTSLRITLEQLRLGQNRTFADCFRLEYHLVQRVLKHHDFSEGVQALLVDKRKFAHWNPATLQDISTEQVIQEYFKAPTEHELVLPSDAVHPMNRRYGLPTDQVIHKTIQEGRLAGNVTKPWKRDDLVEYFVQQWEGKRWTREKVTMTLDTKTTTDTNGYVTWIHQ